MFENFAARTIELEILLNNGHIYTECLEYSLENEKYIEEKYNFIAKAMKNNKNDVLYLTNKVIRINCIVAIEKILNI